MSRSLIHLHARRVATDTCALHAACMPYGIANINTATHFPRTENRCFLIVASKHNRPLGFSCNAWTAGHMAFSNQSGPSSNHDSNSVKVEEQGSLGASTSQPQQMTADEVEELRQRKWDEEDDQDKRMANDGLSWDAKDGEMELPSDLEIFGGAALSALLSVSVAAVGMFAVYFVAKWTGQLSKFMGAREKNKDATSTTTTDAASGGNTEANISIPTAVVADLGVVVQDSVAKWADKLSQLKSAGDKSKGTTTTTTTAETPATSQSVATAEAINPQASMTASVESAAPITDPEQMPSNQGSADSQDPVEDVLGVDGAKQHKQKGNRDWLFWAKPSYWRGSGKKQGQQAADTPASPGTA